MNNCTVAENGLFHSQIVFKTLASGEMGYTLDAFLSLFV